MLSEGMVRRNIQISPQVVAIAIPLFQSELNSLQFQICGDEYDPCNSLQSKAGRHKIYAFYVRIHNLPPKFTSKLDNIYLLLLVNSNDLTTKQTDFNNIWNLIKSDILKLETEGIMVGGKPLKGTLVHTAFDNLGANVSLGFSGSFTALKYCRHCLSSKIECQKCTSESECTLRTVENYEHSLEIVDESESVNLDETDGVKFHCALNDLNYYHIIQNPTVDIMHDICEGYIPKLLSQFFKLCFAKKKFTNAKLDVMMKAFDFGILNHSNIPSDVNFNKRSLGQNAAQSLCLLMHMPFILHRYRDRPELEEARKCIETLLKRA